MISLKPAAVCTFGLLTFCALGNDGGISFGGSPRLLSGHPSVAMASEVVVMTVGDEKVTVDCNFVFKNSGKATQVRMGFPDEGQGEQDPDQGDTDWKKHKVFGSFRTFRSWVDGRAVPTKVVHAATPGKFWHTKVVRFGAGQTRRVRDVYTVNIGGGITAKSMGSVRQASYILHTGSSWRGNIGRSEIIVHFSRAYPANLRLRPLGKQDGRSADWDRYGKATLLWKGPTAPRMRGRTLRFVRTNWRPTTADDIDLFFGYQAPRKLRG